jgi:hypothetical protein
VHALSSGAASAVALAVPSKPCSGCRVVFPATRDHFYARQRGLFGLNSRCKRCASKDTMESRKRIDPTFERIRRWRSANRALHNEYARRTRNNRTPERRERHLRWLREYQARRRRDGRYRLIASIRSQLVLLLRGRYPGRKGLFRRLGYSRETLIQHLEGRLESGMTWANYGRGGWEVDHRIPVKAFDLTDPEQFRACWALDNLRPMWAAANRAKGARVDVA